MSRSYSSSMAIVSSQSLIIRDLKVVTLEDPFDPRVIKTTSTNRVLIQLFSQESQHSYLTSTHFI